MDEGTRSAAVDRVGKLAAMEEATRRGHEVLDLALTAPTREAFVRAVAELLGCTELEAYAACGLGFYRFTAADRQQIHAERAELEEQLRQGGQG